MTFMRPRPTAVTQANNWWCWAACFEILNRAHPARFGGVMRTQSDWLAAMRASPAAGRLLNAEGGINVHYIPAVFQAVGMRGHSWAGPPSSSPDIAVVEQKLRLSYVMAAYSVPGGSHFVVMYGVDDRNVHYFNPAVGAGYLTAPHAQVRSGRLVIGWFE